MTQIVARLDDQLAADLDDLVATGYVSSKSEAIRKGLAALIQQYKRQTIAKQITKGYQEKPQDSSEIDWQDTRTRHMIGQEPW